MSTEFRIDWNESFPHLANPPVVEAVIHWQARAKNWPEPDQLHAQLSKLFPDYPSIHPIHEIEVFAEISMAEDEPVVQRKKQDMAGYRLTSTDERTIVQFKRNGLVFSRNRQYESWETFAGRAKAAWAIYRELAEPIETQRLGVRFINQFPAATAQNLGTILRDPPTCPSQLPLQDFVYQSTFTVPEYPFRIRVVKVMQESMPELKQASGLFLDCDVSSTRPMENEEAASDDILARMRWLKNKVFFALLSDSVVKSLMEESHGSS
jgi:uncharacterized protein (TIGR04255 family)